MQVLQKYGLVRDDKITFGAYLLFVKEFCLISGVQAGRFKTATDIIDSISLNSDILSEIDELIIFIRKHLMVEYIITGNPQREERYDYPLDAIREIVLNMIVHRDYRDYRDSSDSVIKIFDDRIEFFNPGGLYDGLTVEQLLTSNYVSKTRNKLIALMFKECGVIEKYGSGINRIKKLCIEHNIIEPKFEEMQKGLRVILYKQNITTQEIKKISTKEKILTALKKDSSLTRGELAKLTYVSPDAIKQHLAKLKENGVIKRVGSTKSGHWEVMDDEK
jgi:ATP-dependent DNA helicase RecG